MGSRTRRQIRAIFRRYGYNADDPVPRDEQGARIIPEKLLHDLALSPANAEREPGETEKKDRYYRSHDNPITSAELEVLQCIADGLTRKQAAQVLHKTVETVKTQMNAVMLVLDARTAAQACCEALRRGLIR